jgi:hypothetical protein
MVKKRVTIKRQVQRETEVTPLLISAAVGTLIGFYVSHYLKDGKKRPLGFTLTNTYNKLGDKRSNKKLLWLGAIAGGIIGITAFTLLGPKSFLGQKVHDVTDSIKEAGESAVNRIRKVDWGNVAEQLVESVAEGLDEGEEDEEDDDDEIDEDNGFNEEKIRKIVDWAVLGLNVWNNLKKRR